MKAAKNKGTTLLECTLASFIFAVVLISLMSVWALYHKALTQAKNQLIGSKLARQEVESVIATGYNQMPETGTADNMELGGAYAVPVSHTYVMKSIVRGRQLSTTFTSKCYVYLSVSKLRHLIVTVDWPQPTGVSSTIQNGVMAPSKDTVQIVYDAYVFSPN